MAKKAAGPKKPGKKGTKKSTTKKAIARKRMSAAFLRDFDMLAAKHGVANAVVGLANVGPVPATTDCPPGQQRKRIQVRDQFGNIVNMDICI